MELFSVVSILLVSVIIRYDTRRVEAALSKCLMLPLGPVKIEAKAMEEGITFAWDMGV